MTASQRTPDGVGSLILGQSPAHRSPRALAYLLAVACFFLLGWAVYRDDPEHDPEAFVELSAVAREGRVHWREQNCNACHQLYGFGGYLGPDLTHAVERVTEADFEQILRAGVGPMPRIALDEPAVKSIYAFLSEMDRTGQGHLPAAGRTRTWEEVFATLGPSAAPGAAVFKSRACDECHKPLRLGRLAAPDLTRSYERSGRYAMEDTVRRGRRNMPPYSSLSRDEMEQLLDALRLLDEHRAALQSPRAESPPLPWFNYERPGHWERR